MRLGWSAGADAIDADPAGIGAVGVGCAVVSDMTQADSVSGTFEVNAEFSRSTLGLAVRGDLDMATAPELGAIVDAVIDRGNVNITLDLAECDFIDGAGLRVIAAGASRADLWGGTLTIRSPSTAVRRLLDLVGLDLVLRPQTRRESLLEQLSDRADMDRTTFSYRRPSPLGQLGAGPDEMVIAALRLLVSLAQAAVGGADGVSVSLRRGAVLATVAASDQTISDMDANQYATGEGPCVDASVKGHHFLAPSLAEETRWPAFTPRARALGIEAILSAPLMVQDRPVGALNIYSRGVDAFAAEDQRLASLFAAEASAVLTATVEDARPREAADRLAKSLRSRQLITLAQGVVMARDRVDEDQAYTTLRRFSSKTGQPLRERAEAIVASTRWPPPPPTPSASMPEPLPPESHYG